MGIFLLWFRAINVDLYFTYCFLMPFHRWIHDYQDACVEKLERFMRGESGSLRGEAPGSLGRYQSTSVLTQPGANDVVALLNKLIL